MADKRVISVVRLRCAVVDPEWRARWLRGEDPPTLSFAPEGSVPVQGGIFHQLAHDFTEWLAGDVPAPEAACLAETDELWAALYDHFARKRLDELISKGLLPSAHHLSQALRSFCARLAELRVRAGKNFRSWKDIYLTREFRIDRVRFEVPGGEVFVSGRPDAVRLVPRSGVEVVDYKLSRGSSLKHDLVQLAIYSRLLREVKPGLQFSGILEYYEPELHILPVSVVELDGIWKETIYPVLEELASSQAPSSPSIPGTAEQSDGAVDETAERIVQCYANFKLRVEVLGRQEAPQLIRYRVLPANGVRVASLANRAEDLQVALGLRQPPLVQAAPGCVTIDLPKDRPDTVLWKDLGRAAGVGKQPLAFPIGFGVDGELISADFSDPNTCHALVAGASGSGKSEFLKSLIASLIVRNSTAALRLSLVDPKGVTFGSLAECPHLASPVLTDFSAAISCLEGAVEEMDRRYVKLAAEGFESLPQRGADEAMPFWVLVFDEFGDLVLSSRRQREHFETLVSRIAQKGRAAGIHLVLATQRPDRKVVTGLIKSNLPLKICLRVTSAVNSQVVLDQAGAEALLGRGDLLCDRGRALERAQSPLITKSELRDLVRQQERTCSQGQ
ncbi:DNA translocase FtsK [Verrucomicrobiota bacterium sgz303538]